MFKPLILLALIGLVKADGPLFAEKVKLESDILNPGYYTMNPDMMLRAVDKLQNTIYPRMPLPHPSMAEDQWVRDLVGQLQRIGQVSPWNCASLGSYNSAVDSFIQQNGRLTSAVKYAQFYKDKQNRMC